MQEIASHVYIENSYPGVTLGAINWPHGLILIDAPFRAEDARSWRSALLNLGGGVERLLINLDSHLDRTLGARAMDCTVVGHEKTASIFAERPLTFKAQPGEGGAEWELVNGLGSVRWAPPEITFSHRLQIEWDSSPILLQHRPGPTAGSIWVELREQQVIFLGDAVMPNQPPFLASADLPAWVETLRVLEQPQYANATLISGRGGVVLMEDVHRQIEVLSRVQNTLEELHRADAAPEQTLSLVDELLSGFRFSGEYRNLYRQRLVGGLIQYYRAKFCPSPETHASP